MRTQYSPARLLMLTVISVLPACASAPIVQGLGLSSYDGMRPSDGWVTKSRIHVKKEQVLAARTINILPTAFPPNVAPDLSSEQRSLVANAVNRALCVSLSDRFELVPPGKPADLTVRVAVTQATATNEYAAGASAAVSIGASFVDTGTSVPIPIPRIPIGLGNLSVEAEAVDYKGRQKASMLWARGATAFFSSPTASKASDPYELAAEFGADFAYLLVNGRSPFESSFESSGINLPSWQKITSAMGFAPKYAACESYGRSPGIAGAVGRKIGLPPEWTDSGPKTISQPQ